MADVRGTWDERFDMVAATLASSLEAGTDVGGSVAVFLEGEPVVDIWGGYVDGANSAPWDRDTLTNVWSTTKTMTFLCALMPADRGELDFYTPVAKYWPEFAAEGKEGVEVRHLDARLTVAYVMNRMEAGLEGDVRGAEIMLAAAAALTEG